MIITLTTDFGTADTFVGQMKGVILGIAPGATVVDLTHEVPPQDTVAGALAVESAVDAFPDGTIHVVVVDPGVGTSRRALAVRATRHVYVGPDNGVLTLALRRDEPVAMVDVTNPRYLRPRPSATFHGRDVFAPAAAYLATGVPLTDLGPAVDHAIALGLPQPDVTPEGVTAHVLAADRFGNLVTDLTGAALSAWLGGHDAGGVTVHAGEQAIAGVRRTYGDVPQGAMVAYVGSGGRLEVARRGGSAAALLGLKRGHPVHLVRANASAAPQP